MSAKAQDGGDHPPRYIEETDHGCGVAVSTGLGYFIDVEMDTGDVFVSDRLVIPGC